MRAEWYIAVEVRAPGAIGEFSEIRLSVATEGEPRDAGKRAVHLAGEAARAKGWETRGFRMICVGPFQGGEMGVRTSIPAVGVDWVQS